MKRVVKLQNSKNVPTHDQSLMITFHLLYLSMELHCSDLTSLEKPSNKKWSNLGIGPSLPDPHPLPNFITFTVFMKNINTFKDTLRCK